jgi:hypothetical protein
MATRAIAESEPAARSPRHLCSRTKFQICRKSNRGGWTASVHHLEDYAAEEDAENILWRRSLHSGPIFLGGRSSYALCQDCRHIVTEAVKLSPGADIYCLRPDDLRALVGEPEPHRMHAVTPEAIQAAVRENAEWIEAVDDFLAHRRETTGLVVDIKMRMREGFERKDAKSKSMTAGSSGSLRRGAMPHDLTGCCAKAFASPIDAALPTKP